MKKLRIVYVLSEMTSIKILRFFLHVVSVKSD